MRRASLRKQLRDGVREAFPVILEGFLEQAKKGSCQHMKMALEAVTPAKRCRGAETAVQEKDAAQQLLEELGLE